MVKIMKQIIHNRTKYLSRTTLGEIIIDGERFCHTLEDTVRAKGIKLRKETAIAQNTDVGYKVGIRYSNSFNRFVLILYTEDDKITLKAGGISFKYIYAHGGNKHDDTEGCVLVGFNKNENTIYGTAERELFNLVSGWIDAGEEVRWVVTNFKQSQ